MNVPLHGPDHVAADRFGAGLGDERAQDDEGALHRTRRDQHLGDEEVALLEAPANLLQGGDEGLEEDVHRVHPEAETFFGERLDLRRVAVERVLEKAGPDLVFSAHSCRPPTCYASYVPAPLRATIMVAQ